MIKDTSMFIRNILPAYIREDANYSKFIEFLEDYNSWFDTNYRLREFESWMDSDTTLSEFVTFFKDEFLPKFPKNIRTDTKKLLKIAKVFFENKGTPTSFKFLFKALFNTDIEIFPTVDSMLIASGGVWIEPKFVRIKSVDAIWSNVNNYILFGKTSKAYAVIESSALESTKTKLYLSNIKRLFNNGEDVYLLDANHKQVYTLYGEIVSYDNTPPTGSVAVKTKIVGAINSVSIDSNRRGSYYKSGDPVVIYGGINPTASSPIQASAEIDEVTAGGLVNIDVIKGGFGYLESPDSDVGAYSAGVRNNSANLAISLVDRTIPSNVTFYSTLIEPFANTVIGANTYTYYGRNWGMANNANANTTLANALSSFLFTGYPISALKIINPGSGFTTLPEIKVESYARLHDTNSVSLLSLGILSPIQIANSGLGYANNDKIIFTGGVGFGAKANVTSVNANGAIQAITYIRDTKELYPEGGLGYTLDNLPTLTISTVGGTGANLYIPGLLSTGAEFHIDTDSIGEIKTIKVTEYGEDYIATPNVSFKVMDILVSNSFNSNLYTQSCFAYQGSSYSTATFSGEIFNISTFPQDGSISVLRIFSYKGDIDPLSNINIFQSKSNTVIDHLVINTYTGYDEGYLKYGDGTARGSAKFLNGVSTENGRYLNSKSLLSEDSHLQDSTYNPHTYVLKLESSLSSYKNALNSLIHPAGTNIIPYYTLNSVANANTTPLQNLNAGSIITGNYRLTGDSNGYANTVYVTNVSNVSSTFISGSKLSINTNTYFISSEINTSNSISNTIVLSDYVFVGKQNVAISSLANITKYNP